MKRKEMYLWEVASETPPGRRVKTRYHMTREDALARDPTAKPIPGSLQVIEVREPGDPQPVAQGGQFPGELRKP